MKRIITLVLTALLTMPAMAQKDLIKKQQDNVMKN